MGGWTKGNLGKPLLLADVWEFHPTEALWVQVIHTPVTRGGLFRFPFLMLRWCGWTSFKARDTMFPCMSLLACVAIVGVFCSLCDNTPPVVLCHFFKLAHLKAPMWTTHSLCLWQKQKQNLLPTHWQNLVLSYFARPKESFALYLRVLTAHICLAERLLPYCHFASRLSGFATNTAHRWCPGTRGRCGYLHATVQHAPSLATPTSTLWAVTGPITASSTPKRTSPSHARQRSPSLRPSGQKLCPCQVRNIPVSVIHIPQGLFVLF